MTADAAPGMSDWLLLASSAVYKFTLVGFFLVTVMTILKSGGHGTQVLSWFYLIGALEVGKVLCSALIEHYPLSSGERFRPWLILSLAACLASLFLLRQIDPVHDVILLFLACFLLGAMGVFFGCATLGLSCLILPWQWRGFGGVIQTVAARAGKMLGGGLVLWLYHRYGWTAAVDFLLGSSLLLAAQLLFWRERRIAPANPLPFALLFRRFFAYWREPGHGVS